MKRPRFHKNFASLAVLVALAIFSRLAFSQPPPPKEGPSESKKTAQAPRLKPQVIYHLSKSSSDAAALHAQAKAENALPIDSNMPTSLQLARSNANAAAAQATSPTPNVHNQITEAGDRKQHQSKSVTKVVKARSPATNRSIRTAPGKTSGAERGNKP